MARKKLGFQIIYDYQKHVSVKIRERVIHASFANSVYLKNRNEFNQIPPH
ncbi:hypothetical protein GO599_02610 [Sulfolobus islandicus]|nr:hypothetical protein GO599_02610 [Sulfolobus islandicus]